MRFDAVIENLYSSDDELICEVLNEGLHISQCAEADNVVSTGFQCQCHTGTIFEVLYLISQQRVCYKKASSVRLPIGISFKFDPNFRAGNHAGCYDSGLSRSEEDNKAWYDSFDIELEKFHRVKYKDLNRDDDKNLLGFILDGDMNISSFRIYKNHQEMQSYPLFSECIPVLYKSDRFSSYYPVNRESSYGGFDTSWDDYGQSYEKYRGTYAQDVEGCDDDFIDDVLGGEPEAYWNLD